jgi:uncharacterized protein YcaQ
MSPLFQIEAPLVFGPIVTSPVSHPKYFFDNIFLMPLTLADLRRHAVANSLFPPTTLKRAIDRMQFVQADPIRAPARAQDLVLRHRVKDYRAGDLERRYASLGIEEDFFINYGFVTRSLQALMHPRENGFVAAQSGLPWPTRNRKRAQLLLEFIRERGVVHPHEVDNHFSHGSVTNYWGGSSNATTRLLDAMHYQGWLRVVRRDAGIRVYTAHQHGPGPADKATRHAHIDAMVDLAVRIYAPVPASSLRMLVRRLRYAVPQWERDLLKAFDRAKQRLAHANVEGVEWFWPGEKNQAASQQQSSREESLNKKAADDTIRLLAPFDPVVWDRARFEMLWGWVYRFEAYTPIEKRKRGYYALPLLWRDLVIGWANLSVKNGELISEFGYINPTPPKDRAFKRELAAELDRMRFFLGLKS